MYYNGNNRYPVASFMNLVHANMKAKYSSQSRQDNYTALELQKFFQELKAAAQNYTSGEIIGNETIRIILENIQSIGSMRTANYDVGNLFQRRGGAVFERELTDVIQAVFEEVGDDDFIFDSEQVNIGSQVGSSVNFTDAMLSDKKIQHMLEKIGTKSKRYLETTTGNKMLGYYLPEVDGKIDVKGYTITIKANPNARLLEIYNLLKDASFSAKNYDSMTWDKKLEEFVQQTGHTTLSLGKSNFYRAIMGSLSDLGYDDKVSQSAFFAGLNKIDSGDTSIASHFYHLRYMYELTGAGILYNGVSYGQAKYIIYNDPHGDIYVKSTASILTDIIEEILSDTSGAIGEISISKTAFH